MTIYSIAFAFIVLDFLTGLIKAVATNSFTSTKMREDLLTREQCAQVLYMFAQNSGWHK